MSATSAATTRLDVNRAPRQLLSLITGLAFALTFFRFSAARIQAERAAGRRPAE